MGDIDRLRSWQWTFGPHRVLTTAARVGLLHRLARGWATEEEAARDLGLAAVPTGRVLRVLAAMGLVEVEGDRYRLPEALAASFDGGPDDQAPVLALQHELYESWGEHLEGWLRTGAWPRRHRSPERVRAFAEAMWANSALLAPRAVAAMDLDGVRAAVDLGGGVGRMAAALCDALPDVRVTVVDTPEVANIGPEYVARTPHADRIAFVGGDYLEVDLGGPYDLAVISNVVHQETPERASRLIERAARALGPGGRLAIVDFAIDEDRRGPLPATVFAINMRDFGDVYPVSVLRRWMEDAGLVEVEARPVEGGGHQVVQARRP